MIIASQLLDEYQDHVHTSKLAVHALGAGTDQCSTQVYPLGIAGLGITSGTAFFLVLLLHWLRNTRIRSGRFLMILFCFGAATALSYAYLRRQWLQYLRTQAVNSASALTTNLQAFEQSSAATLSLIQEVELVAKGYKISTPLPPISRLEDAKAHRRCSNLRKQLQQTYSAPHAALIEANEEMCQLMNLNDYERYLDIYDVPRENVHDAKSVSYTHLTLPTKRIV